MRFLKEIVKSESAVKIACACILKFYQVKFTSSNLLSLIDGHNDPHSMLAIKDVLDEYSVKSLAILRKNIKYEDIETPFVSVIQKEDWPAASFTVVIAVNGNKISFLDPQTNNLVTAEISYFESIDKDVLLLLDGRTKKDEYNYEQNRINEKTSNFFSNLPFYLGGFLILTLLFLQVFIFKNTAWISPIFLLTSTIGTLCSTLLIWHEIDAFNPLIREVCGSLGSKSNCNAVLSSRGARFLGISWSIWGFAYFSSFFLYQLLFADSVPHVSLWSYIALMTFPYVIYSLYYQAKVVRQWCPLCLIVQCVITFNACASLIYISVQNNFTEFGLMPLINTISIFSISLMLTYFLLPVLKKAQQAKNHELQLKKIRYRREVFDALLSTSNSITQSPEGLGILLGDPNAKNEIIKVCNPYCGPCSKAHPELEAIVAGNPDTKLRIIFSATGEDWDIKNAPVSLFLEIQEKMGDQVAHTALDKWYAGGSKDFNKFSEEYQLDNYLVHQHHKIREMREWYDTMKIRVTPTIFVNGREMPDGYKVKELKNFFL